MSTDNLWPENNLTVCVRTAGSDVAHRSTMCPLFVENDGVRYGTTARARYDGLHPCGRCFGEKQVPE